MHLSGPSFSESNSLFLVDSITSGVEAIMVNSSPTRSTKLRKEGQYDLSRKICTVYTHGIKT